VSSLVALARKLWYWLTGKTPKRSLDRRKKRLRCKRCGSSDVWRIQADDGWYADLMRSRSKKPFECRMCRHVFYYLARRKDD
jgi:hypothetical protein